MLGLLGERQITRRDPISRTTRTVDGRTIVWIEPDPIEPDPVLTPTNQPPMNIPAPPSPMTPPVVPGLPTAPIVPVVIPPAAPTSPATTAPLITSALSGDIDILGVKIPVVLVVGGIALLIFAGGRR